MKSVIGLFTGRGLTVLAKLAYLLVAFSPLSFIFSSCDFGGCVFVFISVLGAGILLGIFSMFQKSNEAVRVFLYVFLHGFVSAFLVFSILNALWLY